MPLRSCFQKFGFFSIDNFLENAISVELLFSVFDWNGWEMFNCKLKLWELCDFMLQIQNLVIEDSEKDGVFDTFGLVRFVFLTFVRSPTGMLFHVKKICLYWVAKQNVLVVSYLYFYFLVLIHFLTYKNQKVILQLLWL